ncbi:hypothetical protein [Leptothoe spongobia]|uniref:Uncharacterized protein n=1 Tax=Leptothoe spongobia TAU-MAC 1115 TaxID=1967444 RepID=A0A947DK25_9CYAN|nr:hypothetical protein [Leptothoe spongobia]MBT9317685.1 hypothetical protein [Leptothoe spongobia TAU-MAC 1115]
MDSATTAQQTHISEVHSPHTSSTVPSTGAHYTAKQLSDEIKIASSTLRTRWFPWLGKVAPEQLLKDTQGYTELARTLFLELKDVDATERAAWVVDAKSRYAPEWESAGVIEGELMPDEVSGVLATLNSQQTSAELSIQQDLEDLDSFIDSVKQAENNFSEAELAAFRTKGAKRGIARFQIETQTELEVYNRLQQKRLEP